MTHLRKLKEYGKVLFLGCFIVPFLAFFMFTICYSSILSLSITIDVQDDCQLMAFYKLFCKLNTNNMTACRLLVVMVFLLCSGQCHIKNIISQLLFASIKYFNINIIISEWQDVYDIASTKKNRIKLCSFSTYTFSPTPLLWLQDCWFQWR